MKDHQRLGLGPVAGFVIALILAAPAAAQEAKLVPVEAKVDFGRVSQGTVVPFEFVLRNEGDAPLNIENVKPSCGCTAALVSDSVVPPGGEARITGTVKTARFQDRITKTITVTSNDPNAPRTTLTVTGLVDVPFYLQPAYLNFGQVKRGQGEQRTATLTVKDESKLPVVFGQPEVKNPNFAVTLTPKGTEDPVQEYDIAVDLSADAPQGQLSTSVVIPVEGEKAPIRLHVFAKVVGDVELFPQAASFGLMEDGKPVTRSFVVMSPTRVPFDIADTQCTMPGCTVEVTDVPNQPDRKRVTVKVDGTGVSEGRVEGTLTIITTLPEAEALTARLLGTVKRLDAAGAAPVSGAPASQPTSSAAAAGE